MTSPRGAGLPLTVGDLLLIDPAPTPQSGPAGQTTILELLRTDPVLTRLSHDARQAVTEELRRLLREALADRLVDLLFEQVSGYQRLDQARSATLRDPRSVERVTLNQFGWRIEYAPRVTVRLDGVALLTLAAKVELIFRASGLSAVVRGGRLIELHAGSLEIEGKLWLQSTAVAERSMSLPMTLILGTAEGLPLAPFVPAPAAVPSFEVLPALVAAGPVATASDDDLAVVHFTD